MKGGGGRKDLSSPLPPTAELGGPAIPRLGGAAILLVLPGPSVLPLPSLRPNRLEMHPLVLSEGKQQPGGEPELLLRMLWQNGGEPI